MDQDGAIVENDVTTQHYEWLVVSRKRKKKIRGSYCQRSVVLMVLLTLVLGFSYA